MPAPGTARIPNGVGCAGCPRSCAPGPGTRIGCALRAGVAGSLTPGGCRCGLGGPRPAPIALVGAGRCRPTPDRIPLGAPPDRDAGRIVPGSRPCAAGGGLLPVLGAPPGGVGRVHRDDDDPGRIGHGDQPGAKFAGGHPADQLPEPLPAAVFLPRLGVGEVQVLDRDGFDPAALGPAQQLGEGVADLGITMGGPTGQVVVEAARIPDGVAVPVQVPGGQVIGVGVHPHHPLGERGPERDRRGSGDLPRGTHIPTPPVHIQVDAVGHRPIGLDAVGPLLPPVGEGGRAAEHVPAARCVRPSS